MDTRLQGYHQTLISRYRVGEKRLGASLDLFHDLVFVTVVKQD